METITHEVIINWGFTPSEFLPYHTALILLLVFVLVTWFCSIALKSLRITEYKLRKQLKDLECKLERYESLDAVGCLTSQPAESGGRGIRADTSDNSS